MEYLADTVAIVRHLRGYPALGPQAARILHDADAGRHHVYLSAITLMEVLYLSEAKRVDVRLDELIGEHESTENLEARKFRDPVLSVIPCSKVLGVPILTGDGIISESSHAQTIW